MANSTVEEAFLKNVKEVLTSSSVPSKSITVGEDLLPAYWKAYTDLATCEDRQCMVGMIGGSMMEDLFANMGEEVNVETPYGSPSAPVIVGLIGGVKAAFIPRHGKGHTIQPTNVNHRANIMALKLVGCTHVLVGTACGILADNIHPGDLVLLDDFFDRTTKREQTFYDGKKGSLTGVCHIPMGKEPFCPNTRKVLLETAAETGQPIRKTGTMVTIEGPRFSSVAESKFFRNVLGAHLINMTTVPEVVLAKEAGLCYCSVALATDYDCWKEDEEAVDVTAVLEVLKTGAEKIKQLFKAAIPNIKKNFNPKDLTNATNVSKFNVMAGDQRTIGQIMNL